MGSRLNPAAARFEPKLWSSKMLPTDHSERPQQAETFRIGCRAKQ
jgi:hypothetical protein